MYAGAAGNSAAGVHTHWNGRTTAADMVRHAQHLVQIAAASDRPAAEAENAVFDARKKFTAFDVRQGNRVKDSSGEVFTIVWVPEGYVLMDHNHAAGSNIGMANQAATRLTANGYTKVAP